MLTPPGTTACPNRFSFINNELAGFTLSRPARRLGLALLASVLLLALVACGSAASTGTPPPPGAPTVASFSPTSGGVGAIVTLTGTNFTGATSVGFNGKAAGTFAVNSATQITASVANGTTTGKISVTTPGGTALSSTNFTITNIPTITSFSPANGIVGTSVTITGTNFTGATAVRFNATAAASFTVNSATQITATVGNGTTTGKITVTTPVASAVSSTNFTINAAAPTITALNPGSGPVGTPVVISGTNFTGATAVAFNGTAASAFAVNSATQITATVGTGSTTGKVTVTTPSGTATSANNFTVSGNATLDLSVEGLYITQATQEYPNPVVPLLQNRSAWVRVFVKANQANTATPDVKVDFKTGATTHTLTITATAASVPLSIDPENAGASWNAAVDKTWILPSTLVTATVDPTNVIPEADETNNTFATTPTVQNLKTWKVTLVPVHTADGNTGTILIPESFIDDDVV